MANPHNKFPMGLCVATLAVTGLGLAAALLGVQWGPGQPRDDALPLAWDYLNVMLGAVWFLVWPTAAYGREMQGPDARGTTGFAGRLAWQLGAICIGAIPALTVAAWLSETSRGAVLAGVGLQMGLAAFVAGMLRFGVRRWRAVVCTKLAVIYLALPALAYLQLEFLSGSWTKWIDAVPAMALVEEGMSVRWAVAAGWGVLGMVLWICAR